MFFVNLVQADTNKNVFHITSILHSKIKVEELHKRRDLPQCVNCQSNRHMPNFCSYAPECVKCGKNHLTSVCDKSPKDLAICTLCNIHILLAIRVAQFIDICDRKINGLRARLHSYKPNTSKILFNPSLKKTNVYESSRFICVCKVRLG